MVFAIFFFPRYPLKIIFLRKACSFQKSKLPFKAGASNAICLEVLILIALIVDQIV